jgi:hypothetical protein
MLLYCSKASSRVTFPIDTDLGSASPPLILSLTITGENAKMTQYHCIATVEHILYVVRLLTSTHLVDSDTVSNHSINISTGYIHNVIHALPLRGGTSSAAKRVGLISILHIVKIQVYTQHHTKPLA